MDPIDDGVESTPVRSKRSWIVTAAVATGLAVGAAGLAGAATGGSSGSSSTTAPSGYGQVPGGQPPSGVAPNGQAPSGQDPATVDHGPGETLLTGDAATKAKEAALAAVPGATVIRVETDSGDAEYEAHLKKADGTEVTVLMDADFKVTSTVDGFGGGPGGGPGGPGGPGMRAPGGPEGSSGSSGSSSTSSGTTT